MKGLLHSKRFRKNLTKWLTMYVGVMLLMTTVITYSRYVSSIEGSDSARVAKFVVKVNYGEEACPVDNTCNLGTKRPTSNLNYHFTLDTNEIEVRTFLTLSIYLHEDFSLVSINGTNVENLTLDKTKEFCFKDSCTDSDYETYNYGTIVIPNTLIEAKNQSFALEVKYNGQDYENIARKDYNVVVVGYSAEQRIGG